MRLPQKPAPSFRKAIVAVAALLCGLQSATAAEFRVGARDEFEIDLDGPGVETEGDLGVTFKSVTLSGGQLPAELVLLGATDFTVEFTATNGNLSVDQNNLVEPTGIGVARMGETLAQSSSLSETGDEALTLMLSSNGAPLAFSGVNISSWRNQFPESQITFVGATVGGSATVTGSPMLTEEGLMVFDTPVTSFTILNTSASLSGDAVRLNSVFIGNVPEPSTAILMLLALAGVAVYRKRAEYSGKSRS